MLAYTHITKTIASLLHQHDCVIVPDFGGYVARQHAAGFSASFTVLHPPAKTILFNKNLVHNDGLLATALMEREGLGFDAALKLIGDYVGYCRAMLQAKNRLELKHLGLFYIDAEQTLRFEPEVDVNFLIDSFGLAPVLVHALEAEEKITPVAKSVFEDRRIAVEQPLPVAKKRNYVKMAALAVGAPALLAMLLFVATSKPMKPVLESSLNPFYSPEKTYTPLAYNHQAILLQPEKASPLLADANGYATFSLGAGNRVMVANISDTAMRVDKTIVKKNLGPLHIASSGAFDGAYQVVVGCFGIKDNAERLVHELHNNNISAGISGINNKGLHIVSCGGFANKADAVARLEAIRSAYPQAWVMAK